MNELIEKLSIFALSPGTTELLKKIILEVAGGVEEEDGAFVVSFKNSEERWTVLDAPGDISATDNLPDDLKQTLVHTAGSWYGEPGTISGVELHDGRSGTLHNLGPDAGLDAGRDGFGYSDSLCAPLDFGLNIFYVYHPETGNLHRFDQDGGLEPSLTTPIAEVFLGLIWEDIS